MYTILKLIPSEDINVFLLLLQPPNKPTFAGGGIPSADKGFTTESE